MSRNCRFTVCIGIVLCLSLLLSGFTGVGAVTAQENGADEEADQTHQHPDEVDEDGGDKDEQVATWLENRLSDSLRKSAVHLEEGEYNQARNTIGDEYDGHLSRYGDVSDDNEEVIKEYERARDTQTALINDVEEYEATYEKYQEAREAGNDKRARELARDLEDRSTSIEERSASLQRQYDSIEENTDTDTSNARESVERTQAQVASTQEEVRATEFVSTELSISTQSTSASFDDPMMIDGRLTTTDGTPVANERITVESGEQTVSTTTNDSGSFSIEYRPTREPLDTTEIDVRVVPKTQSEYDSADATIPVSIEQVEPTVDITEATDGVAFGDEFALRGSVKSNGVGVASVPVVVFVDGERLGEVETTDDGSFELTTTLPADVNDGEVTAHAVIALDDRAIAATSSSASIEVSETPGSIDVTAKHRDDAIYVQGSLTTEDGKPIAGEPVQLTADGNSVETVQTAEDGTYETLIAIPDDAGATVSVDVAYSEEDGNVGDAFATTDVQVGQGSIIDQVGARLGSSSIGLPPSDSPLWLSIAGLFIIGGVGMYHIYRMVVRQNRSHRIGSITFADKQDTSNSTPEIGVDLPATLLDSAYERVHAGDANRAVERAYIAMRKGINEQGSPDTHWEFYQRCLNDGLSNEKVEALQSLTERFEQATFSPWDVSMDDARAAIEEAKAIVGKT